MTSKNFKGAKRAFSLEDRQVIRQIYKEYLKVHNERLQLDRQLLDTMDRREQLLEREKELGIKSIAEKFECSHQCIINTVRPRDTGAI
jgi:hypothetical protein